MAEYQLSYTASEINQKLGMVDTLSANKLDASELDSAIDAALEEAKTSGDFNGEDGVSATHSWDGTVLTITSASGSSSSDLKGVSGVYVGSGDMPDGYNIQIDTSGDADEELLAAIDTALAQTAVRYDTAQTLTDAQKAQARENIGAAADGESLNDALTHRKPLLDGYYNVKAIAHRGLSAEAPENTIPAYILAKQRGFNYVEADVSFTSDGIPVLLHDETIDRTSSGTGTIYEMTYEDVYQYDFGSWFSATYAGTKIPTFEEFILLCKQLGLHPYIEIKQSSDITVARMQQLVDIVREHGMEGKVSWISFSSTRLGYIKDYDPYARCGYLSHIDDERLAKLLSLKTGLNEVFFSCEYGTPENFSDENVAVCIANEVGLEAYTVDDESWILTMNPYITGVTSNYLIAGDVLVEQHGIVPNNKQTVSESWVFTLEDGTTITKKVVLA